MSRMSCQRCEQGLARRAWTSQCFNSSWGAHCNCEAGTAQVVLVAARAIFSRGKCLP